MVSSWLHKMDQDGETPMIRAKKSGYQVLIDLLLRHEPEYSEDELQAATELQQAAYWGLSDAVKKLLDEGAVPHERDAYGDTPLLKAARNGHRETVQTLLERGADVNQTDQDGMTCLHWLAMNGREDLAELLITKGAEVNARDRVAGGLTPMGLALLMGYDELVERIRSHGGDF